MLFSSVDLVPTLLSVSSQPVPGNLTGKNIVSTLSQERVAHSQIFFEIGENTKVARKDEWKYVKTQPNFEQLFNLQTDPSETTNLSRDRKAASTLSMTF